jgi:hypothetical protein
LKNQQEIVLAAMAALSMVAGCSTSWSKLAAAEPQRIRLLEGKEYVFSARPMSAQELP